MRRVDGDGDEGYVQVTTAAGETIRGAACVITVAPIASLKTATWRSIPRSATPSDAAARNVSVSETPPAAYGIRRAPFAARGRHAARRDVALRPTIPSAAVGACSCLWNMTAVTQTR